MFTQEEFESAYEIISGFNNIRKQINDDQKLLTKVYDLLKSEGYNVKDYEDAYTRVTNDVRFAVSDCYISLGYPHEYDRNVFEHFDLLTEVFYKNPDKPDYTEYENVGSTDPITYSLPLFDSVLFLYIAASARLKTSSIPVSVAGSKTAIPRADE